MDIDGVLNNYPDCWVSFINRTGCFNFNDLNEAKEKLTYKTYKKIKQEYRTSGCKENLEITKDAKEFVDTLRSKGFKVIIISSRPVIQYPELYGMTLRWLLKNGINFDNLIFSDRKQYEIIDKYPETKFMVEDNRFIANLVANLGYKVYLVNNKYNQGDTHSNVQRINNLLEILKEE